MRLIEDKIRLSDIMVDPYNPRFINKVGKSQEDIIEHLQKGEKSRELLLSMLTKISWVNKIVVVPIEELSKEEKKLYKLDSPNFDKEYRYLVVEGNTRVACLHNQELKKRFDQGELIPVIITVKSIGESDKKFLQERKRLQSIANVMVVKEWAEVPKAKQMYSSYKLLQENNPKNSEKQILRELSDTLGIKTTIIKSFVYRYAFYKELRENGYDIKEKDFKYLEGLHQNSIIRHKFGFNGKEVEFEWNLCGKNIEEIIEKKQQLLCMFPKIIEIAKYENINCKLLRDVIRKYQNEDIDELYQKFIDLCEYYENSQYSSDGFTRIFSYDDINQAEERKFENNIKSLLKTLKKFPVNEDYSIKFLNNFKEIKRISENIINCISLII